MTEKLTITITGPQGSGKTRWAEAIRAMSASNGDLPNPVIVDPESAATGRQFEPRRDHDLVERMMILVGGSAAAKLRWHARQLASRRGRT